MAKDLFYLKIIKTKRRKEYLDVLGNPAVLTDVTYDEQITSSSAPATNIGKTCQLLLSTFKDVTEQSGNSELRL